MRGSAVRAAMCPLVECSETRPADRYGHWREPARTGPIYAGHPDPATRPFQSGTRGPVLAGPTRSPVTGPAGSHGAMATPER